MVEEEIFKRRQVIKLFRVSLRGMKSSCGISYVIAEDPTSAYLKVKKFVDEKDLGFSSDRELDSVELLADEKQYGTCGTMIFL